MLQGLASCSVQWGAWAGAGMAGNDAQTRARVERTGIGMVETEAGLAAMEGLLLATAPAHAGALPFRWPRFLQQQFTGGKPAPYFTAFADQLPTPAPAAAATPSRARAPAAAAPRRSSRRQLYVEKKPRKQRPHKASKPATRPAAAGQSTEEREAFMLAQVQEAVAAVLGSSDVDPQQPLMAAGLDSLSAVELRNSLEAKLGTELPTTLVFDYPTVAALAGFLASKVQPGADAAGAADSASASGSEEEEEEAPRQRRTKRPAAAGQRAALSTEERAALMVLQINETVAAVLGSSDIDPQQPLMAAGLDSLSAVELRNSLEAKLGTELPTTLVFDYPTIGALAGFLASKIDAGGGGAADDASSSGSEEAEEGYKPVSSRRRTYAPRRQSKRPAAAATAGAAVSAEVHQAFMLAQVQEAVAAVLGSSDVDPQQPLMAAGLDSLSAVELRNSLEAKLGTELPTTLVFDYPTIGALAGFLASKVHPGGVAASGAGTKSFSEEGSEYSQPSPRAARRSNAPQRRRSRRPAAAGAVAAAVSAEEHEAFMLVQLQEAVTAVLGSSDVDPQQPLMAAGLDSLSAVELRNSLEAKLGTELPTTLVFDYPTIGALAGFLASKVQPGAALAADSADVSESEQTYSSELSYSYSESDPEPLRRRSLGSRAKPQLATALAVTTWATRVPGNAFGSAAPRDSLQLVPAARWNLEAKPGGMGG